jgi:hypothetical protein
LNEKKLKTVPPNEHYSLFRGLAFEIIGKTGLKSPANNKIIFYSGFTGQQ